jgi:hypothetical protein
VGFNSRGQFSTSCRSATKNRQETYRLSCLNNWALRCSSNYKHASVIIARDLFFPSILFLSSVALFSSSRSNPLPYLFMLNIPMNLLQLYTVEVGSQDRNHTNSSNDLSDLTDRNQYPKLQSLNFLERSRKPRRVSKSFSVLWCVSSS